MAKKEQTPKTILEREYIIPLRRQWKKVPEYKRANKAVKAIKQFLVKHMKIYDRDLRKIKIDILLNNELRFRGMKKPPVKIKVKAIKQNNDIVKVSLVEIPKILQYKIDREKRKRQEKEKKVKKTAEEKAKTEAAAKEEKTEEEKEEQKEKKEEIEKEKSTIEAGLKQQKKAAKQSRHISTGKAGKQKVIKRKALQK